MATLLRAEIWTSYQCDGGTREAFLPLQDLSALSSTERVTREDVLTFTVPKASEAAAALQCGRVLRLLYDDGDFQEWRIHELADAIGRDGGIYRGTCRSVLFELRNAALLTTTSGTVVTFGRQFDGIDASAIIDYLLTLLPGWWSRGTVTPSVVVSLAIADGSPLTVLRALVVACGAAGAPCELTVVRNSTVGYQISLPTRIGSAAPLPDIRTAKNILTAERQRSREDLVTVVYPTIAGAPALPYVYWRVIAVSGSDIELRAAESNAAAIAIDDQLVGSYLENDAGTKTQITDSVAATSTVTVASTAGYSVGEWCRVVADAAGVDFVRLTVPGADVKVGKFEAEGDLITNIVNNPFLSRWTGSASLPPVGWQSSAGIVSRNANPTYIRRGLYSMRLQYAAPGIIARTDTVNVVPGRGTTYSAKFTAYVAAGTLGVWLYNQVGTNLATTSVGTGWHEIEFTGINVGAATGLYLYCSSGVGTADTYVDSAQITWGAAQSAWAQGSNPSLAWTRANMALVENSTIPTRFTLTVADLERWAPGDFPYDRLEIGAVLQITETELGITQTARILEITRDFKDSARTSLVLERQARTLTGSLARAA